MSLKKKNRTQGFTLIELLVVIAILLALGGLTLTGIGTARLKAQKVQCMNTMRDAMVGLAAYRQEFNRPPIPDSQYQVVNGAKLGTDTIFGERNSGLSNQFVVAVLRGDSKTYGQGWNTDDVNPRGNLYVKIKEVYKRENGVFISPNSQDEYKLYDPWGRMIMIAMNVPPYITERNNGTGDKILDTKDLTTYADSQVREEDFAIWSYGKDGALGKLGKPKNRNTLRESDDVVSW